MSYHSTVREVYRQAAEAPAEDLCCVPQALRHLPGLHIPDVMHEMNYGCGTTIHLQDMTPNQRVVYVGVGGGLEALQLAYFTRRPGGVVAIDPVAEMRQAAGRNLALAAHINDWFDPSFVDIRAGDALDLPLEDAAADFAAQNCLFNIFKTNGDLERALAEMYRVLRPGGRLVMSDPVSPVPLPRELEEDELLRAQCLSGCLTLARYLRKITATGFGAVEVRSRRPYRLLDAGRFPVARDILLETVEVAAFKTAVPEDGPCVFTGRTATYAGPEPFFDDRKGHLLKRGVPSEVCDKTAAALLSLDRSDLMITEPTWHYQGGGCC